MHDLDLEGMAPEHLRAGVRISTMWIAWTVCSSAAAVALGLGARSLVLLAFGFTGLLDAVGSAALVAHFRHALRHETFSERHERRALRIVTIGLVAIGAVTALESARRLMEREPRMRCQQGSCSPACRLLYSRCCRCVERDRGPNPQSCAARGWMAVRHWMPARRRDCRRHWPRVGV